jgi:hypothetical protein
MEAPKMDTESVTSSGSLADVVGKGLRRATAYSGGSDLAEKTYEKSPSANGNDLSSPTRSRILRRQSEEDEELTDRDGWLYADNKWEYGTAKAGMGKVRLLLHLAYYKLM